MGRYCGFLFYRFENGKFIKANVVHKFNHSDEEMVNWFLINGRCDATTIFLKMVKDKETYRSIINNNFKPEKKYFAYLLLNHPELDGFENKSKHYDWFSKYFYIGLDTFQKAFDFDEAQKQHDDHIQRQKKCISEYREEIESLRTQQKRSETKAAFECFEEKIQELREKIVETEEYIIDIEEDDYDYNHYMWIKEYLEVSKDIIDKYPEVVVFAFAMD